MTETPIAIRRAHPSPRSDDSLVAKVRRAWAEVLDLDDASAVPLDVNFLDAGGSSLLLIMLWERLHQLSSREVRVSDLFEHSTVRAQAALLASRDEPMLAASGE